MNRQRKKKKKKEILFVFLSLKSLALEFCLEELIIPACQRFGSIFCLWFVCFFFFNDCIFL